MRNGVVTARIGEARATACIGEARAKARRASSPRAMDALASSDALVLASATVLCASVVGLIAARAASNATGKDGTMTTASWFGALGRGRAPATAKETFDDAGKVRLSVFYGTQTGTSERYAREVVAHARAQALSRATEYCAPEPSHSW